MVFQGIIGFIQVAPGLKRVRGTPVLILTFTFPQHKQPVGKEWQKSICRFYFRELPLRLLGVSTRCYAPYTVNIRVFLPLGFWSRT